MTRNDPATQDKFSWATGMLHCLMVIHYLISRLVKFDLRQGTARANRTRHTYFGQPYLYASRRQINIQIIHATLRAGLGRRPFLSSKKAWSLWQLDLPISYTCVGASRAFRQAQSHDCVTFALSPERGKDSFWKYKNGSLDNFGDSRSVVACLLKHGHRKSLSSLQQIAYTVTHVLYQSARVQP